MRLFLLVALALPACARAVDEGEYVFQVTERVLDSCGTDGEPIATGATWTGFLDVRGDTLVLDMDLHGARGDQALTGRFTYHRDVERFLADATFPTNVDMLVDGAEVVTCPVFLHLRIPFAEFSEPGRFFGTLRADYTTLLDAPTRCPESCVRELEFRADHHHL